MYRILLPLFVLMAMPAFADVSASAPANAIAVSTLYSGQQLLAACTQNLVLCRGYVSGVVDATETFSVGTRGQHWCSAMQATDAEMSAVVIKYLTDHPDKLAQSAQSLTTQALTAAYCPAQ